MSVRQLKSRRRSSRILRTASVFAAAADCATSGPIEVPKDEFSQLLEKQLPCIAHDAQQALEAHVEGFSGAGMKSWISAGTAFKNDTAEICPYCGQSVEGLDLIEHYQAIFEETYEAFEDEVATFSSRRLEFSQWATELRSTYESNYERASFWAGYIDSFESPSLNIDAIETALENAKAEMEVFARGESRTPCLV